jgi:glycerol-3-phosphate dehydrogenase (NAD(P)+)
VCRNEEQARLLTDSRENRRYLPGVRLPDRLRIRALQRSLDHLGRADLVFLAVPSSGLAAALSELVRRGLSSRAGVVSLAKGLVPPDGLPPSVALHQAFDRQRIGCVGGPAHALETVEAGAGLVCASYSDSLGYEVADLFQRSGVVCEVSLDPVGVELAGCAKNAAALAAGATEAQGLNAAGMAAADIFTEALSLVERRGGRAHTFVGRAGTGDLVATALAPSSRNRSAGELLAKGLSPEQISQRLGQASEALETVPLLARATDAAGVSAPVISALARLIAGTLPLDQWVELVRARQPESPHAGGRMRRWLGRWR